MTEMDMVDEFHSKFELPVGNENLLFGSEVDTAEFDEEDEVLGFRIKFIEEELQEFCDACAAEDKVKALDALIDLVYVAMGTALFMGVTKDQWNRSFQAVHDANMSKIRVKSAEQSASSSGRGSSYDVVKPPGFVPPNQTIRRILGE